MTLHQREVKAQPKALGRAELVAACRTPETCNELARVLRDSIPGNQATPYCAAGPEPDGGLPLSWETLLPSGPQDVEKACIRWAVCSHQQEPSRAVDVGLACLKEPNGYERGRRCASGATCYDVAKCAGQGTRGGPELPLWRDFGAQAGQREAFWRAGRLLYSPGGDPLSPAMLYGELFVEPEIWQKQKLPGRWFIVATGYDATNPVDMGDGVKAMQSASGTWQLQYATLESTIFGPERTATGEGDATTGVPSFQSAVGRAPELLFDYDADGTPEVGVYESNWHHTLPPEVVLRVWTVKQGRILPYAPAENLSAVGVKDVDNDGRPDLLLDSRRAFFGADGCSYPGDPACAPETHSSLQPDGVAHSLSNGRFSTNDAVALKAAREL